MDKTCSVEGCNRLLTTHSARGMCQAHYLRWQVHGDPGPAAIKEYDPSRLCSVEGCGRRAKSRGWCTGHYERWRRTGDAGATTLSPWTPTGGNEYTTLHTRTSKRRGRAASYPCQHCGQRAQQWAYDHTDPAEVTGYVNGCWLIFSLDPDHYIPLCIRCHRQLDKSVRLKR